MEYQLKKSETRHWNPLNTMKKCQHKKKSRQHIDSVTKILHWSPSESHQHHCYCLRRLKSQKEIREKCKRLGRYEIQRFEFDHKWNEKQSEMEYHK